MKDKNKEGSDLPQGKSLMERLAQKRKEIEEGNKGKGNILFLKPGTTRIRILPVGEDNEFGMDVVQFYLGGDIKGVFSPSTYGGACPIAEYYEKLKKTKKPSAGETALMKALVPKKKVLVPAIVYKDDRGKEIDEERGIKLVQLTSGTYGEILDYFLDPDDGDPTDPINGYDLKIKRVGSGKMDTEYSVRAASKSELPKKYRKLVDLEELVKAAIPTYEDLVDKLAIFLNTFDDSKEEEEDDRSEKRKKKARK